MSQKPPTTDAPSTFRRLYDWLAEDTAKTISPMSPESSEPSRQTSRKARIIQDEAVLREERDASSPAKATYKRGDIIHLYDSKLLNGVWWDRAADDNGNEGFLTYGNAEEVTQPRFRVERIVFIIICAAIAAIVIPRERDFPAIAAFGMSAFLIFGCYFTAGSFLGNNFAKFWEAVNEDQLPVPAFDWHRFVIEPLFLIAAVVLVMLVTGFIALFKWSQSK